MIAYRIQDKHGRGPWRQGFSVAWVDKSDDPFPEMAPIGEIISAKRWLSPGEWMGCACSTLEQLRQWFTQSEYERLLALGFKAVRLTGCREIKRCGAQSIVARKRPMHKHDGVIDLYDPRKELVG